MNEFDDMVSGWKGQPVPTPRNDAKTIASIAQNRISRTRQKHIATIAVLAVTLLVLVAFAICEMGSSILFIAGVGLMIGAVAVRIGLEWWSVSRLHHLDVSDGATEYLSNLNQFINNRQRIHGGCTYLVFGLYVVGFCLLLPLFKQTLSHGFFTYILLSGAVVLTVLFLFIRKKIRQELCDLRGMKSEIMHTIDAFKSK